MGLKLKKGDKVIITDCCGAGEEDCGCGPPYLAPIGKVVIFEEYEKGFRFPYLISYLKEETFQTKEIRECVEKVVKYSKLAEVLYKKD